MSESYGVGTRAWQVDQTEGWVASEVIKKTVDGSKVKLVFKLENGEVSYAWWALIRTWDKMANVDVPTCRPRISRSPSRAFRAATTRHYHH